MIYTDEEIEVKVSQVRGTHVKRNNLRNKLKKQSNKEVNNSILILKAKIRGLKAFGYKEFKLTGFYSQVTQLEIRLLQWKSKH